MSDCVCITCEQVRVSPDMNNVSVTWAARGDVADKQIAELLPTFASQLRSVSMLTMDV